MTDDYRDPHGIVHRDRIVKTSDNIEMLGAAVNKLSIEVGVMQSRTDDCHERAERLAKAAQEKEDCG